MELLNLGQNVLFVDFGFNYLWFVSKFGGDRCISSVQWGTLIFHYRIFLSIFGLEFSTKLVDVYYFQNLWKFNRRQSLVFIALTMMILGSLLFVGFGG